MSNNRLVVAMVLLDKSVGFIKPERNSNKLAHAGSPSRS